MNIDLGDSKVSFGLSDGQPNIFELDDTDKFGVSLTPFCLTIPRKTCRYQNQLEEKK